MDEPSDLKAAAVRGLRAAIFAFLGTFVPAMVGWLHDVSTWAADGGATGFPTTSALVYTAASALAAASAGFVGFLWNWLENAKGFALFGAKKHLQS